MSRFDAIPESLLAEARARHEAVRARIERAAERSGRNASDVTLVGVAKRQPLDRILAAIAAGVRVLGQSYVQEARRMRPEVEAALASADHPSAAPAELAWHMVGRLQRNKAGLAVRLFDVVESIDRPELADALAQRVAGERRPLDVLLQVDLCGEPQKGGCDPDDLARLAEHVQATPSLTLRGLMTVPAADPDPENARPVFARLRTLREDLAAVDPALARCDLSMGMSADLDVAIEEGATLVRVGTALFGERGQAQPSP